MTTTSELSSSSDTPQQARDRTTIPTRRVKFDFDAVDERFWFNGNGLITATLSALSATFPPGEKEFVRSVMHYRDKISDPVLRDQMRSFAAQEGHHSYQHRQANAWLDAKGFDATGIEADVEQLIEARFSSTPPAVRLASTVILEHITAILAEFMLTNDEAMGRMPEPVRELLMWHAVEEIEHKAVAFDVFQAVNGDRNLLRRVGAVTTAYFLFQQVRRSRMTLEALDHKPTLREYLEAVQFFFGPKGLFPQVIGAYRDFYRADFHPWDHDNRELVAKWKSEHEAAVLA